MEVNYYWYDFVGNIGVVVLIYAYFQMQSGKLSGTSLKYQLLNIIAALLIITSLCFEFNLSSFIIEIIWILISGYGIYKNYGKSNS